MPNGFWNFISGLLVGALVALALILTASKLPIPGNYRIMTVLSGSMEPAIHTGAVIAIKPTSEYRVGDIITFGNAGDKTTPVTHRLVDIQSGGGTESYTTKGDANPDPDTRQIGRGEILGKVLFSIPYLGYVLEFLRKPIGFFLVIILPAAVMIIDEIVKIYRETKKPAKV